MAVVRRYLSLIGLKAMRSGFRFNGTRSARVAQLMLERAILQADIVVSKLV